MSVIQKYLAIEDVQAGMVAAEQICNAQGQVLLQAGAVLTEELLQGLRRRQVGALSILFTEQAAGDADALLHTSLERLEYLFRAQREDDASGLLKQALQAWRKHQYQAEQPA
ncbi:hypothetical protein V8J88_19020 [Massilia sp. W12]|uniref:hypothetical protein n=1 Tax=Massilia sp. W12 TaxID=3126507 RepID=UPI0030D2502F